MQCFVWSTDLMFASQATGAANSAGMETKTVADLGPIAAEGTHIVILDLTTIGLGIADAVTSLKQRGAVIIAVGPHVHEAKLSAARDAGADHVVTKGQASRELAGLLDTIANSQR